MKNLDRSSLILALKELGKHALEESVELEICIYGGSAMLLAYDSRNATKDIDAICKPREIAKSLASKVARKLDLHEDWLNDQVIQFLGPAPFQGRHELNLDIPGLKIFVATSNHLLAMKALACRDPLPGYQGDHEDLVSLIRKIGIHSVEEIQERVDQHFPDEVITPRNKETLETLIKEVQDA